MCLILFSVYSWVSRGNREIQTLECFYLKPPRFRSSKVLSILFWKLTQTLGPNIWCIDLCFELENFWHHLVHLPLSWTQNLWHIFVLQSQISNSKFFRATSVLTLYQSPAKFSASCVNSSHFALDPGKYNYFVAPVNLKPRFMRLMFLKSRASFAHLVKRRCVWTHEGPCLIRFSCVHTRLITVLVNELI